MPDKPGRHVVIEGRVSSVAGDSVALAEPSDYEPIELCGAQPLWNDGKGHILASVNRFGRGRVVLTAVDFMVPRQQKKIVASAAKMPLVELLMRQIVKEVLPIEVHGDIEYGVNKVSDGWWVYLINNKGVTKYTTTPEKADVAKTAKVTVAMRGLRANCVHELRTKLPMNETLVLDQGRNTFTVYVGPGDIRIVKIVTDDSAGQVSPSQTDETIPDAAKNEPWWSNTNSKTEDQRQTMKRILTVTILLLISLAVSQAAEIHVATTGKDSNPGSQTAPLRTIQRAADSQPGDVVTVHEGVYRDRSTRRAAANQTRSGLSTRRLPARKSRSRGRRSSGIG